MRYRLLLTLVVAFLLAGAVHDNEGIDAIRRAFPNPPEDSKIMMRWWWFGTAVTPPELERELRTMKNAGIGGIEIQPVYPLELDDPRAGIKNRPYLSQDFLAAIASTAGKAREMGMRVDVTLGSGWPYGGPRTSVRHAAGHLRIVRSGQMPAMDEGEELISQLPSGLIFISSRTGQQVKRAAVGAEGFVLDHYDRAAIEEHLASVAEPLLKAFGDHPPRAVFSDSLEVYASDWTPDFLQQFQQRRGYDLRPYLPALVGDIGENTFAIRHDWGKTLTELAEDNYLKPIAAWAHAHHTLFRSQTYGEPPVMLSSNALVDLPEGEHGPIWRRFSAARWASSASHLYGKPVTSTETWTWLHSPTFRATPLDLKAEADRHFVQGINQLVGHGWPYSPASAGEPGWRFYAAAALNDHNPWFHVMPDIARYLQRVSFLMRQGQPVNDIAIYLPTDDGWAHLQPGKAALDEAIDALLGDALIPAVLDAGYNFDFIDDRAMQNVGLHYKTLILPGVERIPLGTLRILEQYVASGGRLIATRSLPSLAPGLLEEKQDSAPIRQLTHQLFETGLPNTRLVPLEQDLSGVLRDLLPPDLATGSAAPEIGFMHRTGPFGDIYFVANMSNHSLDTEASIRNAALQPEWWDPYTSEATPAAFERDGGRTKIGFHLVPYESRILVFSNHSGSAENPSPGRDETPPSIDLSADWQVTFPPLGRTVHMARLRSWTDDEETRFYSGVAIYAKSITVPESFLRAKTLRAKTRIFLDFGPGTPVEPEGNQRNGMRALLESPVRESATVSINGEAAGAVWRPPYELEITRSLHPGRNELRMVVGNLAINEMAQRALPDYRLLNLRYGERFVPQDMDHLEPLPSGILGPVRLVAK